MILLEFAALILLACSFCCMCFKTSRLCRLWETYFWGKYWVAMLLILFSVVIIFSQKSVFIGYIMGLFSPYGLLLPAILAGYLYCIFKQKKSVFHFKWYDVLFLSSLQLILILSSWTVLPWDIYRLGYLPYSAFIALLLICYTYLRQLDILTVIFTLGLLLWALGIGSNNYFDWIQHTFVLIFAWGWLLMQLLIPIGRRLNLH